MPETRVLLIADEYYASLAGVRALHDAGYATVVATTTADGYARRSRAAAESVRVPSPAKGDEFLRAVGELARRVDVVLPGNEASMEALAGRDDLVTPAVLGAPPHDVLQRLTNKDELARVANEVGLGAPAGITLPPGMIEDVTFPAVVKPVRSVEQDDEGNTIDFPRAVRVTSTTELRAHIEGKPGITWLVQPFVEGPLVAVAGVSRAGETFCTVHQRAHRIYPRDCGVSAYAETVAVDPELDRRVRRLVEAVGFTGVWQAQFIAAADGHRLIDFNPRLYGSLALAIAAGANLPAILVDALLGKEPGGCTYRPGIRYRSEMRELGAFTEALRARELRRALEVLTPRRRTTYAVVSRRDLAPAALLARRMLTRLRGD